MTGAQDGLTLLVLAGGQGRRFGGLKQMAPVGPHGETMLDYAVFDALRAGFTRVVFVVGASFAQDFEARIADRYAGRVAVACVCQHLDDLPGGALPPAGRTRPWGTLHAVWAARALLQTPFAVINADDFYGRDAYHLIAGFLRERPGADGPPACAMVAYAMRHTLSGSGGVNRGVCEVHDGWLQSVVEHTDILAQPGAAGCTGRGPQGRRVVLAPDAVASMNLWGFAPAALAPMGAFLEAFLAGQGRSADAECFLPAFVDHAITHRVLRCRVLPTGARWFGMTYAQDRADCAAAIRTLVDIGDYPRSGFGTESVPLFAAK